MSRRARKRTGRLPESRHQRTLQELGRARLARAEGENGRQDAGEVSDGQRGEAEERDPTRVKYTLDWTEGSGSFFVPRLEDLPPFSSNALRKLVICTAKGEKTPPELKSRLMECSGDEIATAIAEGIHRWHNYGKERR